MVIHCFFSHSSCLCLPHKHTHTHARTVSSLFSSVLSCHHLPCFQGWRKLSYCWLEAHKLALPGWGWGGGGGVGPGIGSLVQHPGLVIVSNKPPILYACCWVIRECECLQCYSKLDIWFCNFLKLQVIGINIYIINNKQYNIHNCFTRFLFRCLE